MAVEDLLAKMDGDPRRACGLRRQFISCNARSRFDYDAFRQSLDALDTKIIPRGGTDIAAAIHETEAALEGKRQQRTHPGAAHRWRKIWKAGALEAGPARRAKKWLEDFLPSASGSASGELIPAGDENRRDAVFSRTPPASS